MARGGARPGAGRPKNARTSTEAERKAAAVGISPLDYMLAVINDERADEARRDQMAIAAAPFIHPLPSKRERSSVYDAYLPPILRGKI